MGIHPYPAGVFWTIRIPEDSVAINLGAGRASYQLSDVSARDFFSIPNSLNNGASARASASFAIQWSGVKDRRQVHNDTLHVSGLFLDTGATMQWSASNDQGFSFASDDDGQTVVSAQIGHERNGVFFS